MSEVEIEGGAPLPELSEGLLDDEALSRLLDDIQEATQFIGAVIKQAPERHVGDGMVGFEVARRLFEGREVRAVQLRYVFDGVQWWDTLMWTPGGARLVRIGHDR